MLQSTLTVKSVLLGLLSVLLHAHTFHIVDYNFIVTL